MSFYSYKDVTCCSCGMTFGVPSAWEKARREDHAGFKCPNGHSLLFDGPSPAEKLAETLRLERDRLKQQLAQKDDEVEWQRTQRKTEERRVIAAKGQITKLKKRAKAGVCPCCNRTFANMAAHMKTQHPDMDPNVIDLGVEKAKRAEA